MIFKDSVSLIKDIKSGNINPVYLLHGEESFHIDEVSDYIENNILEDSEKPFNQQILYGQDIHVDTVLDYALQYPMMSQYRVLIIKEAQKMGVKSEDGGDSQKLIAYLKNPSLSTILVIAHKGKKVDGRAKWFKTLKEQYPILESNPIRDYQVKTWVEKLIKAKGYSIDSRASDLIAEYLGTDLSKISNEIDKLIVNLPKDKKITMKEVETNIGISKDYNVFELQAALINKDAKKVGRIVSNFQANMKKNPMEVTLGSLFSFYQRLYIVKQNLSKDDAFLTRNAGINPYFLRQTKSEAQSLSDRGFQYAFKILSDYDGRIKGFLNRSTSREELLKEMVGKLLVLK